MRNFALAGLLLAQLLLAAVLPASAYPGLWKGALGCDGPCRWPPLGLVRPASRAAPAGPLSFADRIDTTARLGDVYVQVRAVAVHGDRAVSMDHMGRLMGGGPRDVSGLNSFQVSLATGQPLLGLTADKAKTRKVSLDNKASKEDGLYRAVFNETFLLQGVAKGDRELTVKVKGRWGSETIRHPLHASAGDGCFTARFEGGLKKTATAIELCVVVDAADASRPALRSDAPTWIEARRGYMTWQTGTSDMIMKMNIAPLSDSITRFTAAVNGFVPQRRSRNMNHAELMRSMHKFDPRNKDHGKVISYWVPKFHLKNIGRSFSDLGHHFHNALTGGLGDGGAITWDNLPASLYEAVLFGAVDAAEVDLGHEAEDAASVDKAIRVVHLQTGPNFQRQSYLVNVRDAGTVSILLERAKLLAHTGTLIAARCVDPTKDSVTSDKVVGTLQKIAKSGKKMKSYAKQAKQLAGRKWTKLIDKHMDTLLKLVGPLAESKAVDKAKMWTGLTGKVLQAGGKWGLVGKTGSSLASSIGSGLLKFLGRLDAPYIFMRIILAESDNDLSRYKTYSCKNFASDAALLERRVGELLDLAIESMTASSSICMTGDAHAGSNAWTMKETDGADPATWHVDCPGTWSQCGEACSEVFTKVDQAVGVGMDLGQGDCQYGGCPTVHDEFPFAASDAAAADALADSAKSVIDAARRAFRAWR